MEGAAKGQVLAEQELLSRTGSVAKTIVVNIVLLFSNISKIVLPAFGCLTWAEDGDGGLVRGDGVRGGPGEPSL